MGDLERRLGIFFCPGQVAGSQGDPTQAVAGTRGYRQRSGFGEKVERLAQTVSRTACVALQAKVSPVLSSDQPIFTRSPSALPRWRLCWKDWMAEPYCPINW